MRRLARFLAGTWLVAVVLIAVVAGCGGGDGDASVGPTQDPRSSADWVVVADLSQSTRAYRDDFLHVIELVLEKVRPGDRLTVLTVEKTAVTNARYLVEHEFPQFMFSPSPRPEGDNEMRQNNYKADEAARLAKEQAAWDADHDLAAERAAILRKVKNPILKARSTPSDIFGGLFLAGNALASAPGGKYIVLLSDGLVNYSGVNWQHQLLNRALVRKTIARQRKNGDFPELAGAQVFVVGAAADNAREFASLRQAWVQYIRATGGNLDGQVHFVNQLDEFGFSAWLDQAHSNTQAAQ